MSEAWVGSRTETIQRAIGETKDEMIIAAPDIETIRGIGMVEGVDWPRNLRLLTTEERLKDLRRDFLTATQIADLIQRDTLELRTVPNEASLLQPLLITSDDVACLLLPGQDDIAAVRTDAEDVFHFVRGEYLSAWGNARAVELKTPAYSRILQTIGEEFDEPMQTDVETMLQSSLATRAFDENLDEIHATLLLAAKHERQYNDITQWGDRIGLGSAARFSKRKQDLEDAGLIGTEKVTTGTVGRPRQRLVLADARLREAGVQDIITAAQSVLPS